ncbi:MAG: flagellar basal body P-ring protein FlgI, partial [Candidatus Brocadiales bacterium]|nr:flagellar basal body P-ring protein FlgI [Candidatus Brocadiales bacterium]
MFRSKFLILILIVTFTFSGLTPVQGSITTRIKDVASVQGMRENYLFGYGLVIGLMGSGDKQSFSFTTQLAKNVFEKLGAIVTPADFISKNIAAVLITANIRPF